MPDQFTLETQKNMVEFSGGQGILNIDVLSFHRLAYRVLEEMPVHRRTVLEDMGKMMLLRKVFAEEKKNLVYFKRGLNKPGFLDECKSFFCELMQYAITEEDFSDLFGQFEKESLMSYKMQDLQLIYRRFMEKGGFLHDGRGTDPPADGTGATGGIFEGRRDLSGWIYRIYTDPV